MSSNKPGEGRICPKCGNRSKNPAIHYTKNGVILVHLCCGEIAREGPLSWEDWKLYNYRRMRERKD